MVLFKFIGLFTFSHTTALESTRGLCHFDPVCGPLQWSGSTFMWLRRTLKNYRKISSLLNMMAIFVCKACGSGFVSVLERQRAFLEDRCHQTVVWQKFCRTEFTFRPCPLLEKTQKCFATPQQKTATFTANPTPYSFEQHYSNSCQQFLAYVYSTHVLASNRFWVGLQCLQLFVYPFVYQSICTTLGLTCARNHANRVNTTTLSGPAMGSWVTHPLSVSPSVPMFHPFPPNNSRHNMYKLP